MISNDKNFPHHYCVMNLEKSFSSYKKGTASDSFGIMESAKKPYNPDEVNAMSIVAKNQQDEELFNTISLPIPQFRKDKLVKVYNAFCKESG